MRFSGIMQYIYSLFGYLHLGFYLESIRILNQLIYILRDELRFQIITDNLLSTFFFFIDFGCDNIYLSKYLNSVVLYAN